MERDNVIPDQMILQLRKLFNWVLLHVILDTIVTFDSQLNCER